MRKFGKKLVAGILATVSLCGAFTFTGCKKEQSETADKPSESVSVPQKPSYDGTIVQAGGTYNFSNKIAFLGSDIMPTGEDGEYTPVSATIIATVLPADANQAVSWRVSFADANDEWAKGKTATDYVTITTEKEGSTTATVTCIRPFGAQIKLECISQDNPGVKAECMIDLTQAIENVSLTFGTDLPINLGGQTDVVWEINPNGIGKGGTANVVIDTYDAYTVAVDYTWDIDLVAPHEYYGTATDNIRSFWGIYDDVKFDSITDAMVYTDGYFVFDDQYLSDSQTNVTDGCLKRLDNINSLTFDNAFLSTSKACYIAYRYTYEGFLFSEMSVSDMIYKKVMLYGAKDAGIGFGGIKEGSLYTLQLNITGVTELGTPVGSKTYKSLLYLTGYTNTSGVQSVQLDKNDILF